MDVDNQKGNNGTSNIEVMQSQQFQNEMKDLIKSQKNQLASPSENMHNEYQPSDAIPNAIGQEEDKEEDKEEESEHEPSESEESVTAKKKNTLRVLQQEGTFDILDIKVLSSTQLESDFSITIGPMGIIQYLDNNGEIVKGSKRNDGYTYFGMEDEKQSEDEEGIQNDLNFPTSQTDDGEPKMPVNNMMGGQNHKGQQFYIRYDPSSGTYMLKDLGRGFGVFVKLLDPIIIRDGFLINIGESYIVSYLIKGADIQLKLKIFPPGNLDQPEEL